METAGGMRSSSKCARPLSPSERKAAPFMQRVPTNHVGDIDGAAPKQCRWATRPIGSLRTDDIDGARKKERKAQFNKPDSHDTKDIDGAAPRKYGRCFRVAMVPIGLLCKCALFTCLGFRTARVVDPLDPVYALASCPPVIHPVPKFLRNELNVSDIDGAQPRRRAQWKPRDSYNVDDIDGARVSWKSRRQAFIGTRPHAGKPDFTFDVSDIVLEKYKTGRCTNPLDPAYFIHGQPVFDSIRWRKRTGKREESYIYKTDDIPGAQSRPASHLRLDQRTQFRKTNNVADIPGARKSTRKGALSNRRTNPLNPRYQYLHGGHTPTPSAPRNTGFCSNLSTKKPKVYTERAVPLTCRSEPSVLPSRKQSKVEIKKAKRRQVEIEEVRNLPNFS